jgi:hypothetical protein
LSKKFENNLRNLITGYSPVSGQNNSNLDVDKSNLVGLPGFEPGSIAPEATSLDQTSRQPQLIDAFRFWRIHRLMLVKALNLSG